MPAHYRDKQLHSVYSNFATFGQGSLGSLEQLNGGDLLLDNAKFVKLFRDHKLIDKKLTTTDLDIIFNKVKAKGARKLDFKTFKLALEEAAVVKYQTDDVADPYDALVNLIVKKELTKEDMLSTNTRAVTKGTIYEKLTDHSKYTGTHKLRFDEEGKGRGLAGRVEGRDDSHKRKNDFGSRGNLSGSIGNLSGSRGQLTKEQKPTEKPTTSVFDRLTTVNGYTGTHKHRFNADGSGRGLAGRDSISKSSNPGKYHGGDVKHLGQILRNW